MGYHNESTQTLAVYVRRVSHCFEVLGSTYTARCTCVSLLACARPFTFAQTVTLIGSNQMHSYIIPSWSRWKLYTSSTWYYLISYMHAVRYLRHNYPVQSMCYWHHWDMACNLDRKYLQDNRLKQNTPLYIDYCIFIHLVFSTHLYYMSYIGKRNMNYAHGIAIVVHVSVMRTQCDTYSEPCRCRATDGGRDSCFWWSTRTTSAPVCSRSVPKSDHTTANASQCHILQSFLTSNFIFEFIYIWLHVLHCKQYLIWDVVKRINKMKLWYLKQRDRGEYMSETFDSHKLCFLSLFAKKHAMLANQKRG